MNEVTAKAAYRKHRLDARHRGIEFLFSYPEWAAWWEAQLGPDWQMKRGCRKGQHVMARNKDQGPYAPWNVRCATVADNHAEYNANRKPQSRQQRPKLTKEVVLAIYADDGSYDEVAQRHGVGHHQVHCIKAKKYYRSITDR